MAHTLLTSSQCSCVPEVQHVDPVQRPRPDVIRPGPVWLGSARRGRRAVSAHPGGQRGGAGPAAEYITYRENIDLPNPEEIIAAPKNFVIPNRMDKVYVIGASLMAVLRNNMTLERWEAVGVVLERIASGGHTDLAVTFARDWLRERPTGATPDSNLLKALIPLLTEAKMI